MVIDEDLHIRRIPHSSRNVYVYIYIHTISLSSLFSLLSLSLSLSLFKVPECDLVFESREADCRIVGCQRV